ESWSTMFSAIVARAEQIEVLSTGSSETFNGMLQLIQAEYQVLSIGLPTRQNSFLRYCKQHGPKIWAVVDVPADYFHPFRLTSSQRWPSGCLIKEKPMGCSKVTWIDHVEVNGQILNYMYQPLVDSGFAYGAKRWIAILQRQSERLAFLMASNNLCGEFGVISTDGKTRRSLLRLAERMVTSFCSGFGSSYSWNARPDSTIGHGMIQTRMTVDDPLCGTGTAVTAAASYCLRVKPDRLFDYLLNKNFRNEWDFSSFGGLVKQTAHVFLGNHPGNCVSLLRIDDAVTGLPKSVILIESNTDVTGSQIVYTPLCINTMQELLNGGNPETVFIFPSGFNIHPGPVLEDGSSSSSLVTFSLKALIDSKEVANSSQRVQTKIEKAVMDTISRIESALARSQFN
ncbi:Homeobox-leucine zipper protein hdg2, partial [Thalictrum thalictroides]